MTSEQQYLPIEVTIATNYVISFLYNKLPRRRVDVFAEELSSALHKKLASDNQQVSQRAVRISVSPPLDIDSVVTDAIRSSGLTVEEVVQELPHALALFVEAGEVSYCLGNNQTTEPIPIYSTRRALNENGQSSTVPSTTSGGSTNAFLNPSVDAAGLLDGVDPNLLALLSIRPIGNNSSAAVPTAVFAQTKFGSTKFRSQNSGSARRPARLNGSASTPGNGQQNDAIRPQAGQVRNPTSWPNGAPSQTSGIVSPPATNRFQQQNENVYSSPSLPPVVTSAAAAVLGSNNTAAMASGRNSSSNFRTPTQDFAYLLQDLQGCGSSVSSPALSDFTPLHQSFDARAQRHSYHGNGQATTNSNNSNVTPSSSSFFSSNASSTISSMLFDSGIVSPTPNNSSWSTPVNKQSDAHSNSSSTSSSLGLFGSNHCGTDSWGLNSSGNAGNTNNSGSLFGGENLTGTSQWVQSLRLAAVNGTSSWDQLTATES